MKKALFLLTILCVLLFMAQISSASLVNGGFESGNMTGWTLTGSGGVQTSVPDIGVKEGSYSGRISAGLGVDVYTTLSQTFDLAAGDTITGWYALRTSDRSYHDLAYGKITTGSGSSYLWQAEMPTPVIVGLNWVGKTDWTEWSWTAPESGTYTLEFGVANVGNNSWSSTVYLDNITISAAPAAAVPIPPTVLLFGTGLVGLVFSRGRRKK